jgi:hypothetical protein
MIESPSRSVLSWELSIRSGVSAQAERRHDARVIMIEGISILGVLV